VSNSLAELIDEIQFKSKLSLEEIADSIGYSRPHLNKEKLKGENKKLEGMLREKFKEILQNVPGAIDHKYVRTIEELNEMYKKEIARLQAELNEIHEIKETVSEIKKSLGSSASK
jgi:hypothetical protein